MAPANAMILGNEACRNDDVSLMEQAILIASQPNSRHAAQDVIQRGLKRSAARGSVHVLRYVLDHGADVEKLIVKDIMINDEPQKPSQEVLEMLVAHGWDVNNWGDSWPLLWFVVEYPDLVEWGLNHGAHVDVPDPPLRVNPDGSESRLSRPRPTILGAAASSGGIDTFELLRKKGAPLDRRTLHMAVERAAMLAPKESSDYSQRYKDRFAMVRHLVDVVELDVNAKEHYVGDLCTTPLCYIARRPTSEGHRELIGVLLNRGADPELDCGRAGEIDWPSPIACARSCGNSNFLKFVQEWRGRQSGDGQSGQAAQT